MIKLAFKIYLLLSVGYIQFTNTESHEDASEEYEAKEHSSLNSESYEAFNTSSKENRIDSEDTSDIHVNESLALNHVAEASLPALKSGNIRKQNKFSKKLNQTVSKKPAISYPFSVSIQRKSAHYTSGALIEKQWVVTSASEFYNVRESIKMFRARLGSVNCKKGGILVPLKQVEVHPSYVQNKPAFDVALLKLAQPVEHSQFVAPISIMQTRGRVINGRFLSTYWPRLIVKGHVLPASAKERVKHTSMRISTENMIPWEKCRKIMEITNNTLEPSSLCLEPIVSHHSLCMPDPGAPVFTKDGLWGITSGWTHKRCLTSVSPTVVTKLSSPRVHSWLQLLLVDL